MLQEGADRAQQAGLLKQCLACWNVNSEPGSEIDTVDRLAGFVQQSQGPSAVQIVDIAQVNTSFHVSRATFDSGAGVAHMTP